MVFFNKPAGGPDSVGGVFPWNQQATCRNRAGATITKGQVVQLALRAGNHQATEIATNDSNSYQPGASNDTIWNTIVDPQSTTITNGTVGILNGGVFGVALEDIDDNDSGDVQFFGIVEAFVVESSGSDGCEPGQVLSVTATNSFNCHVGTNAALVAIYVDSNDTSISTTPVLKRVFLTNGLFLVNNGAQVAGIARS